MTNARRVALVVFVVVVAVVVLVVIHPGSTSKRSSSTRTATSAAVRGGGPGVAAGGALVRVADGRPVGGVARISVRKGQRVRFAVRSDVADEVHVHGYDLHRDVPAGGEVAFSFPATIDGVFVVELERRSEQIAELRVSP